ncbi:radical SAM protein [Bdellovibrio sp. HCB-110]|uniref:radical SAM protein n=2 Tax=Bdellovibrio TaxID=958 RepID=UPI0039B507BA
MENVAKTLTVTTECSGGCTHCPFSSPQMKRLHLPLETARQVFAAGSEKLVVVSGGEPLEYPYFFELLSGLQHETKKVRIATGGHKDLAVYLESFKGLINFDGISLGTDVISARSPHMVVHSKMWRKNVVTLNENNISYSLTLTILDDQDHFSDLLEKTKIWGARPQFIYLRVAAKYFTSEVKRSLEHFYPTASVIVDELS